MKYTPRDYIIICSVLGVSIFSFWLVFDSINIVAKQQVALVSEVGASVPETPINKLASQLRDRSNELDAREKSLNEREQVLIKEKEATENRVKNILITTISLSLITLFIINGYIYKRDKTRKNSQREVFGHFIWHHPKSSYSIDLHNINNKNTA